MQSDDDRKLLAKLETLLTDVSTAFLHWHSSDRDEHKAKAIAQGRVSEALRQLGKAIER